MAFRLSSASLAVALIMFLWCSISVAVSALRFGPHPGTLVVHALQVEKWDTLREEGRFPGPE